MNESIWEDNLLERKVESDLKDLLKTLVAFANSVKPGHTAVLLIGEKDDGTAQGVTDPDNIQKTVRAECDKIYPAINWRSKVYEKEGKQCIRVEVEHSGDTPHFGGAAWVRKGSETIKATDEQFQRLIDIRSEPVMELSKWINKEVSICGELETVPPPQPIKAGLGGRRVFSHRWPWESTTVIIRSVNKHWVTFEKSEGGRMQSEPLRKLTLSFDDRQNRLLITVAY